VPERTGGELPLDQYAALGDGRSVALVAADGSVDWWCVPNMDSKPLFDRLLDPAAGGRFAITPAGPFAVERRYRPDSNVLEQTFTTPTGAARLTDSLNSGISGRLPWSELARRVEGLHGAVTFDIAFHPGRRLDQASSWREPSLHGDVLHIDGIVAAFRADAAVERRVEDDDGVTARLVTAPGSRSTLAILASADEPLILPPLAAIDARIDRSDQAWREWTGNLAIRGDYPGPVRRSALALKLLLFSPTGATAAAATAGLPERIGGGRNYDYRYAWVRDVAYTIKAFLRVGATEEAKAAFSWLTATIRRHDGHIRTMFRLDGALAPAETDLDLPGYRGSRPVRAGNRARDQLQLGVFGDLLETAALFVNQGHVLDLNTRRLLADLTDRCADLWRTRDSGIWEFDQPEHYTMSKIGCWTALDRAVRLAGQGQVDTSHVERWQRERDRIRDWVDRECWSEAKQAYTLHPGTDRLDAALLLAVRFGFDRPDRLALTREAIRRELCRGPFVYRCSGMADEEGTFLACAFWLVEAFALLGDRPAAIRQMDALLAACSGNLGLLHEEFDPATGEMLGNVPQALSHLALIHAATAIDEAANGVAAA
jgi:GH15 family glucan-1,4-alpha-glucosidase